MAFADLTANLNLNISNFSANLSKAAGQMDRFTNRLNSEYKAAASALKTHNIGLKDTARIVQGIVVSQMFYRAAGAISDATKSLWDFNVALDYMKVTYSALFGSTDIASDFMQVLQEHSINTIFSFQQLADASKKLLAYGIDYKNLMFVMEGLTNLGAMSGDPAALDRIALALGQIYTKGKLSAEEMRQLANAYIPITDILQERFGLTGDQLKNVSKLNLPAADVINAIVDYANDHFGAVGDAAMLTITGIQNKIVDTLKVVGTKMLGPINAAYKSFLVYVSKGLEALRGEFETGGIGGVFEYLVPDPATQQTIRQFVANVKNLLMSLVSVGAVAGQVFGHFLSVLMTAFNVIGPFITGTINLLTGVLNAMLNTRAGALVLRTALLAAASAFFILRVQALYALVVTAVTKAIDGLSRALLVLSGIIVRHPIVMLIAAIGVALIGLAASSEKARAAISKLFGTIGGAFKGEDQLVRTNQELRDGADAAGQFDNRLSGAADSADDLTDALKGTGKEADKASKKVGGLLSFDEVFRLPEEADKASSSTGTDIGSGLIDAIGDLTDAFGDIGDLGANLIPEIPDFGDFIKDFTDKLFGGLDSAFMDKLAKVGWGSLIGSALGGIFGGLLGGPAGAALGLKIGAFAGGVAGLLFDLLDGAISNTVVGGISGILMAISKALGTSLFGALKGVVTSGQGWSGVWSALSGALKTTGLKGIIKGGLIGMAIGLVVDTIAHFLWGALAERFEGTNVETAKVGQTIGSAIGAIAGGIFFGPVGAMVGSAIGTFAGGLVGLFWEPIKEWSVNAFETLSDWVVDSTEGFRQWAYDCVDKINEFAANGGIKKWATDTLTDINQWVVDSTEGFRQWAYDAVDKINEFAANGGIKQWATDTLADINQWVVDSTEGFRKWVYDAVDDINEWADTTEDNFNAWKSSTLAGIKQWSTDTLADMNQWVIDSTEGFRTWANDVVKRINDWSANASTSVRTWSTNTKVTIQTWISETRANWSEHWNMLTKRVGTWSTETARNIATWSSNAKSSIYTWFTDTKAAWHEYWTGLGRSIGEWLETKIWRPIANFFDIRSFWRRLSGMLSGIYEKISGWWDSIRSIFSRSISVKASVSTSGISGYGHATGGIFNREHIARFAEGNKAEAIIPLENDTAMQPFVNAVAGGLLQSLAPILAQQPSGYNSDLPPMYVGTLIADDNGIKELYKKFRIIQVQENARRGTVGGL